ncbi:MAG: iron-sulfur cluster-binding domain-containing protein [Chitinophagaceae bacterium]
MGIYRTLSIDKIKSETSDCKTFYLSPADNEPLVYQPGQFLTFVFTKPTGEERRSYSLSSTPALHEPISITVKRLENGEYSRKLFDYAKERDILITTGAAGFFVLPGNIDQYQEIFFIAAGSGIAPVLPLIKTVLHQHTHIRAVLIYSNRSGHSTIFYDELVRLKKSFADNFVIEFLFSSALNLERARLSKWLLGRLLKEFSRAALEKTLFYTCGPFDYMRMVSIALLENRVPLQHIKKENFALLKIESKTLPPDTHKHRVEIQWQHKIYYLETQYPQTILQAAKKAGIVLPYSCESGRCGSCAAICVEGKVWMSYNEMLMDDEMEKGRVLTCTGYPVNGNVVLRYE